MGAGSSSLPVSLQAVSDVLQDPSQSYLAVDDAVCSFELLDQYRSTLLHALFPPQSPSASSSSSSSGSGSGSGSVSQPHIRILSLYRSGIDNAPISPTLVTSLFRSLSPPTPSSIAAGVPLTDYRPSSSYLKELHFGLYFSCCGITFPESLLCSSLSSLALNTTLHTLEFTACFSNLYWPGAKYNSQSQVNHKMTLSIATSLRDYISLNTGLQELILSFAGLTPETGQLLLEGVRQHRPGLSILNLSYNPCMGSEVTAGFVKLWSQTQTFPSRGEKNSDGTRGARVTGPETTTANERREDPQIPLRMDRLYLEDTGCHTEQLEMIKSALFSRHPISPSSFSSSNSSCTSSFTVSTSASAVRTRVEFVSSREYSKAVLDVKVRREVCSSIVLELLMLEWADVGDERGEEQAPLLLEPLAQVVMKFLGTGDMNEM